MVAMAISLAAAPVFAQDEKPAKKPKPAAAKRASSGPLAKPKMPATAAPAAAKSDEAVETVEARPDPAVEAVLESKPSTPAEFYRGAKILADLGRADLAKSFLQKILDAKLDDPQLKELVDRFGSAAFTGMALNKDLAPQAGTLADVALAAVSRLAEEPKRLAALVAGLLDPSNDARARAMIGLQQGRAAAVAPILAVLADPKQAAARPVMREALVELGADAVAPLLGALESPDAALVAQVIQALGAMGDRKLAVELLAPFDAADSSAEVRQAAQAAILRLTGALPAPREAAALLSQTARTYLEQRQPLAADSDAIWHWDPAQRQLVARKLPVADASRAIAARLARDAYQIAPHDAEIRNLYWTARLESAVYQQGLDKPLAADDPALVELAKLDVETLERLLDDAMHRGYTAAAALVVRVLGGKGSAERMLYQGNRPSPLVLAARDADRRLRMASIAAIMRLQPARPYPGSSYLPESLGYFAASSGARRVLVASPHTETAMQMAGSLTTAGYQIDVATSGRELVRMAMASPDYEFVLIDMWTYEPTPDFVVQQLRHDYRSAGLRVGLLAREGFLPRARQIADVDKLCLAFSRPRQPEELAWQVQQLATLAPEQFVPFAVRQQQAVQSLAYMAELAERWQRVYDVYRLQSILLSALHVPTLARPAAAVMENVGTPEVQRALVEVASQPSEPLELRDAALASFRHNVQRHGILLTTPEIVRQYRRYNQSESSDRATQRVLGGILDCLEATRQARSAPRGPSGKPAAPRGT
jgi:CheY-like chemotaxis protein